MTKTIMIVDDQPDIRTTVKTLLEKNGYRVVTAVNGNDCLEKLKKMIPDLILLDIMMPGMPAKTVVEKIKKPKIIFFSVVRTSEAEKENLLKNPIVVDFIQKPFKINEFLGIIKKNLEDKK